MNWRKTQTNDYGWIVGNPKPFQKRAGVKVPESVVRPKREQKQISLPAWILVTKIINSDGCGVRGNC
jgi:hypothetical protein